MTPSHSHRLLAPILVVFLLQLVFKSSGVGLLDVEDIESSRFDVSILTKPVLLRELPDDPVEASERTSEERPAPDAADAAAENGETVLLSSKYGQMYRCSLPPSKSKGRRSEAGAGEQREAEADPAQLLASLKEAPCLFYTKGWWTYELCVGRDVKQYHFEGGDVKGEVMSLGIFDSDFNWEKLKEDEQGAAKPKPTSAGEKKMTERNFHSQFYSNGSLCDLTGESRKTEVRFKCDATLGRRLGGGSDEAEMIAEIEEPSTCAYLFEVVTTRLCDHPWFKPWTPPKPATIVCNPALSKPDFDKYSALQERTAKKVREMGEKLKALNRLYEEKKKLLDSPPTPSPSSSSSSSSTDSPRQLSPVMEKFFKEVYSPKRLKKSVEESTTTPSSSSPSSVDEDLEEFRRETEGLSVEQTREAKTTLASQLKGQFQSILQEAKDEMRRENDFGSTEASSDASPKSSADASAQKKALQSLTETLNKLLEQLDKTERRLDSAGVDFKETLKQKREKWWRKHEEKSSESRRQEEKTETKNEEEKLDTWIRKTIEKEGNAPSSSKSPVKVRITKISKSGTDKTKGLKSIDIEESERARLSKAVQEELEKAGLMDKQDGRQVEVRIVTSGYFSDDDDDGVHTLDDVDSRQFRQMLSSLIGANSGQISEEYRRNKMENNYKFVWRDEEVDESSSSSSSAESSSSSSSSSPEDKEGSQRTEL